MNCVTNNMNIKSPIERTHRARNGDTIVNRQSSIVNGFTLIELLVVIAVIGVLAALIIPVAGSIKKRAILHKAEAEMNQLETAIERYKADYGFYPPDNGNINPNVPGTYGWGRTNQLFYELSGTTNTATSPSMTFATLDNSSTMTAGDVQGAFGVQGFMNCAKPNGDDTASSRGKNFLPDLNPQQVASGAVGSASSVKVLVTSATPMDSYAPMPGFTTSLGGNANPWRYVSSHPKNNPNSYDLWVNIVFKPGETNLVCNWSSRPLVNSPWQ